MASDNSPYIPALALESWNYIRYVGPGTNPPLFLCVEQDKVVVTINRLGPTQCQWFVNKPRIEENDVNNHTCSFKYAGTQNYLGYTLPLARNEVVISSVQTLFKVLRITPTERPCHIKVREQEPDEGACDKQRKVEPEVEWYLGVSDDLSNVILKPFLTSSESSENKPIWQFTTREEAMAEDNPRFTALVA